MPLILKFPSNSLDLNSPKVMGILNITPDSFFDGGKYNSEEKILQQVEKMLGEGASIIDVGACSSRPGAAMISSGEEELRGLPVVKLLRKHFPKAIISVDTFRSAVAEKAVDAGADMINDISGGTMDERMFEITGKLKIPYVLMHIRGTPQTMQKEVQYDDVLAEVMDYFSKQIDRALSAGIEQIIIDPGFGFAKTPEQNFILLDRLAEFKKFGFPLLAGISRKSMINRVLGTTPGGALNGTSVANTIAMQNGASILRVHDVKEAVEAVKICSFVKQQKV